MLPPASHDHQPIEFLEQCFRVPVLVLKGFSFGAPNLSLNAILMKTTKQLLRTLSEVQSMQTEGSTFPETGLVASNTIERPNFHVFPTRLFHSASNMRQQT